MRNTIILAGLLCLIGCTRTPEPWESSPVVLELERIDEHYRQEWLSAGNPEKHKPKSLGYLMDHQNELTRARLIKMARNKEPRPGKDDGDESWLGLWTTKDSGYYDRKFDRLIRELAPDWFERPK